MDLVEDVLWMCWHQQHQVPSLLSGLVWLPVGTPPLPGEAAPGHPCLPRWALFPPGAQASSRSSGASPAGSLCARRLPPPGPTVTISSSVVVMWARHPSTWLFQPPVTCLCQGQRPVSCSCLAQAVPAWLPSCPSRPQPEATLPPALGAGASPAPPLLPAGLLPSARPASLSSQRCFRLPARALLGATGAPPGLRRARVGSHAAHPSSGPCRHLPGGTSRQEAPLAPFL